MALIENGSRGFLVGLLAGVGLTLAGRALFGPLRPLGRPLAKAALRTGLEAMDRTREAFARYGETIEDLLAEVRSEMAEAPPAGATGVADTAAAASAAAPAGEAGPARPRARRGGA